MKGLKRLFKRNSHTLFFKGLAVFGRSLNRLYENRNHDIYSNGELTVIKKIARVNPVVIFDGGANIGKYSLVLSKYMPDCKIYAFEPVKNTFRELSENIKELKNVTPVNKGLYSETVFKEINLFSSHTHSSLFDIKGISYESTDKTTIELVRGDDYMTENGIEKIDFLKLDLEGAEYDAIKGFETAFRSKKIKAVQFEYGYINISTKKLLIDYYTLLQEYGYKVGKIFPKTVEFRDYKFKYEDFLGPNFIAVLNDEKDLIRLLKNR
jgi:FkbM family methyltransferase